MQRRSFFCVMTQCNFVEGYQRFGGTCCLVLRCRLEIMAAGSSKTTSGSIRYYELVALNCHCNNNDLKSHRTSRHIPVQMKNPRAIALMHVSRSFLEFVSSSFPYFILCILFVSLFVCFSSFLSLILFFTFSFSFFTP